MANNLWLGLLLLLAICSPALTCAGSSLGSPSFTSFVACEASHFGVSAHEMFKHLNGKITPRKYISIKAYLEGYKLVDSKVKAKLPAKFNKIVSNLKQLKATIQLLEQADLKIKAKATGTKAQYKAKKAAQAKAEANDKTKPHGAEEKQAIADEMQRMIKIVKAAKEAGKEIPKVAGEDHKHVSRAEFNKLDRPTQLKLIAQRRFRRNTTGFTNALAFLAWKELDPKIQEALIAEYPVKQAKPAPKKAAAQTKEAKISKDSK